MIEISPTIFYAVICIPTIVAGLFFWWFQKNWKKREKREEARKENEILLIDCVTASMALGKATAKAVQLINPKSNGDMIRALEYTRKVEHDHRDFLKRQGIENFH